MLPVAAAMQKQGASRGATVSFLVATPETGVDSIAVTYALIDPFMTLARPVAAFFTACLAGMAENLVSGGGKTPIPQADHPLPLPDCTEPEKNTAGWTAHSVAIFRTALVDIWAELAPSFFTGLAVASVISAALPENFLAAIPGGRFSSMLMLLAAGIPMYICASASTPVAAALILKGASPGAALVFLLSGPATNVATLTVLGRLFGPKSAFTYLVAIVVGSVTAGLAVDEVYRLLDAPVLGTTADSVRAMPGWFSYGAAAILLAVPGHALFVHVTLFLKNCFTPRLPPPTS